MVLFACVGAYSDTVTVPTKEMLALMQEASLGDDVFGVRSALLRTKATSRPRRATES